MGSEVTLPNIAITLKDGCLRGLRKQPSFNVVYLVIIRSPVMDNYQEEEKTYSPAGQLKLVSGVMFGLLYAMVITWCGCRTI